MLRHETWVCFGTENPLSFGYQFHYLDDEEGTEPLFDVQIGALAADGDEDSKIDAEHERYSWIADIFASCFTKSGEVIGFQILNDDNESINGTPSFEVISADEAFLAMKEAGQEEMSKSWRLVPVLEGEIEGVSYLSMPMRTFTYIHDTLLTDLLTVAEAYQEWIKSIPSSIADSLPAMPGIDGDFAEDVLDRVRKRLKGQ